MGTSKGASRSPAATEASRGKEDRVWLDILAALMRGDSLDVNEAMRRWGVSHGTAGRCLALFHKKLPKHVRRVKEGHRYVYTFESPHPEPPAQIAEALAASFGASFANQLKGTSYEEPLRRNQREVIARLIETRQRAFRDIGRKLLVLSNEEYRIEGRASKIDEVLDAILSQRLLSVKYERFSGEVRKVRIRPYSFAVSNNRMYILAEDDEGELHKFRFDRMKTIERLDEHFEYPLQKDYDPSMLFQHSIGVFTDGEPRRVVLRLDARWATYASHHKWHHSQEHMVLEDGDVEVRLMVRTCPQLEEWILGFGEQVEVVEPEDLRRRIADRIEVASARYIGPGVERAASTSRLRS